MLARSSYLSGPGTLLALCGYDRERAHLASPKDRQRKTLSDPFTGQHPHQIINARDGFAIEEQDYIPRLNPHG
jgi:hypothetical protein